MPTADPSVPDSLPLLSRGKHRSPRKGACFMELVSYLAGERWSDHPPCTHPLVAAVARCVNDFVSDDARPRLAGLIPAVIGLTSDDPHVDARVALLCARAALPVVSVDRQRVLAVAVLACEQVLDDLDDRPPGTLEDASLAVLTQVPDAVAWARGFSAGQRTSLRGFRRHAAPTIVARAVEGIARSGFSDADERLAALLREAIEECRAWAEPGTGGQAAVREAAWDDVCGLTGTVPRR